MFDSILMIFNSVQEAAKVVAERCGPTVTCKIVEVWDGFFEIVVSSF